MRIREILAFGGIIIAITILFSLYNLVQSPNSSQPTAGAYVIIDGVAISVEIADEPVERSRGLMFMESLPEDQGMFFVFDKEDFYSFWMMNVNFSLDIIWINSDGIVVDIERNAPPCFGNCPSYKPKEPAKYVLEVNSGFADDIGLREGSFVEIMLPNN